MIISTHQTSKCADYRNCSKDYISNPRVTIYGNMLLEIDSK